MIKEPNTTSLSPGSASRAAACIAATGSASYDFYGANRLGDNLYANSVLALDARTGTYVWHYQVLKHDLWDRDLPAAPALVTITRGGRTIDAVAQITKTGHTWLFEREKGTPLFPQCGFSSRAIAILDHCGVAFESVDVLQDMEIRQAIKAYSDWPTIPQLYVKGEFVGGCDIVTEMALSGELDTLFEQSGITYWKEAADRIREANKG